MANSEPCTARSARRHLQAVPPAWNQPTQSLQTQPQHSRQWWPYLTFSGVMLAQLAPVVAIEAIIAWLDAGQPDPAKAATRVRQAVMGVIGAAVFSDVDCTLHHPANPEGPPS